MARRGERAAVEEEGGEGKVYFLDGAIWANGF